ncbi:hypothetical protein RHS01_10487 [Rhizoctonia solani]|uniref:Uncharacterized protein n=1 Tax=Rhizoctonia solani TaxID=456999 RepID=A0A8H7I1W7_9AGAM|nr:hypothetical protein RHS01_10487 [Rhizoctonia solani]
MPPAFPPRALPVVPPGARAYSHASPEVPEIEFSNEPLVTYIGTNGEEECAIVGIDDSYEKILSEACINLAAWLPSDWQDRRKDFAREVRNRKGDMVWAAVQPSLVIELGRLGRLPELRLRIHPPPGSSSSNNGLLSTQNNLSLPNETTPAYEAEPQVSAVDGIVQAVLHKLFSENSGNLLIPGSGPNSEPTMSPDTKARLRELEDALLASESQAPPPPHDTLNSPMDIPLLQPSIANRQSPPSQLRFWGDERTQTGALTVCLGLNNRGADHPPPLPVDRPSASNIPIDPILWASAKSVSDGKHNVAIHTLLSAPRRKHRVPDDAGPTCLSTRRQNPRSRGKLRELLSEAKRHQLKATEIKLLCEICQLACTTKDLEGDCFLLSERAKLGAQSLGDMWLKAEASQISGMVNEAKNDLISALQAYSGAIELYQGASSGKANSPITHVKEVEMSIQRIKHTLAEQTTKSKSRFRRFF